jgi:hypothetical protein
MRRIRTLVFIWVALFLVSCAPNPLLRGLGLRFDDDKIEPYSCPLAYTPDQYKLHLKSSQPIPTKVAIVIDGKLKHDECASSSVASEAPFVNIRKSESNNLDVIVFWIPDPKPMNMSFEILDRGDCSVAPSSFFVANNMPISFQTSYYDEHHDCGSYEWGETVVTQ